MPLKQTSNHGLILAGHDPLPHLPSWSCRPHHGRLSGRVSVRRCGAERRALGVAMGRQRGGVGGQPAHCPPGTRPAAHPLNRPGPLHPARPQALIRSSISWTTSSRLRSTCGRADGTLPALIPWRPGSGSGASDRPSSGSGGHAIGRGCPSADWHANSRTGAAPRGLCCCDSSRSWVAARDAAKEKKAALWWRRQV